MEILASSNLQYGGKINVNGPIAKTVLNKIPIVVIEVRFNISIDVGTLQEQINAPVQQVGYRFENAKCTLWFNQLPITHNFEPSDPIEPVMAADLKFVFRISLQDIKEIESKRNDDLEMRFSLRGTVFPYIRAAHRNIGTPENVTLSIPWRFSQKEWVKFLSEIGYGEKWIVEVDRPLLEGFHEIIDHLEK
ncbi:MAG: hypothetical protein QW478_12860, partial [Candidatus Micrarchaeaceae archaeon]